MFFDHDFAPPPLCMETNCAADVEMLPITPTSPSSTLDSGHAMEVVDTATMLSAWDWESERESSHCHHETHSGPTTVTPDHPQRLCIPCAKFWPDTDELFCPARASRR
jgi:hypothetical protein